MTPLRYLLVLALVAGCASRSEGDWQEIKWARAAAGAGNLAEDKDACMAEVVAGSQPTRSDRQSATFQSFHNRVYRREHMRTCMRDRGWSPDPPW